MGPMSVDSDWLVPIAIRLARAGEISAQIQDAVKRYNESDAIDIEHVIRNDRVTDLVLRIHRHPPARLALHRLPDRTRSVVTDLWVKASIS